LQQLQYQIGSTKIQYNPTLSMISFGAEKSRIDVLKDDVRVFEGCKNEVESLALLVLFDPLKEHAVRACIPSCTISKTTGAMRAIERDVQG
jgi:hypothetical protein